MSKQNFSDKEMKELLENGNVVRCSPKAITYAKDFKIRAVKQYNEEGKTVSQIFKEAGFDLNVIGKDKPCECLRRWRRIVKLKGVDSLTETRGCGGGRPRTVGLTDSDRIKRMEAEIAYLKAENDFLAKLRAKRAE